MPRRLDMRRDPCSVCNLPVFLAEKLVITRRTYHRTCFRCARCTNQLTPGNFYETEDGDFCCETCPDEDKSLPPSTPPPPFSTSPLPPNMCSLSDSEKCKKLDEKRSKSGRMRLDFMSHQLSSTVDKSPPQTPLTIPNFNDNYKVDASVDKVCKYTKETLGVDDVDKASQCLSVKERLKKFEITSVDKMLINNDKDMVDHGDHDSLDLVVADRVDRYQDVDDVDRHQEVDDVDRHQDVHNVGGHQHVDNVDEHQDVDKIHRHQPVDHVEEHQDIDSVDRHQDVEEHQHIDTMSQHADRTRKDHHSAKVEEHQDHHSNNVDRHQHQHVDNVERHQHQHVDNVDEHQHVDTIKKDDYASKASTHQHVDKTEEDVDNSEISLTEAKGIDLSADYPEDMNPFNSDDDDDQVDDLDMLKTSKISTNQFGSSEDDDEEPEKVPTPAARKRIVNPSPEPVKRLLHAPQINLNPFWSDDDDGESDEELKTVPVPKPRTIRY